MATRSRFPPSQRRALARLSGLALAKQVYLAGGGAVALHLGHRVSVDIDLFGRSPDLDLDVVQRSLLAAPARVEIISRGEVTLHARLDGIDLDVVRYPFPLLVRPTTSETGLAIASIRDLAAMKLAAIAKRGLYRDFWDLYVMLTRGRLTLRRALEDYVRKFDVAESDVYHVLRALSWFEDAERDPHLPRGLTRAGWKSIRACCEAAARTELARRAKV